MWGNMVGWIIGAVLGIGIIAGTWLFASSYNRVTPPTAFGKDPETLAVLKLPVDPSSLVPMRSPGDAGSLYQRAIADVRANEKKYDAFLESTNVADAKKLAGVQAIMDAAPMSGMKLLSARPEQNIGYFEMATPPDLEPLLKAARCVERAGLLYNANKNYAEAKKCFNAQFALGAKLFDERVMYMQAFNGMGQMRTAATMLQRIAETEKDAARAQQFADFLEKTQPFVEERMNRVWKVVNAVDGPLLRKHTGDIYYFTNPDNMQEHMWRVEATLKLGRFRFNVGPDGHAADQVRVPERLAALQQDPNPLVQTAAKKASELTLQDYRLKIR